MLSQHNVGETVFQLLCAQMMIDSSRLDTIFLSNALLYIFPVYRRSDFLCKNNTVLWWSLLYAFSLSALMNKRMKMFGFFKEMADNLHIYNIIA